MLAVATSHRLAYLQPATLKQPQPTPDNVTDIQQPPSACVWTPDNSALFITSSNHIHKYDPPSNSLSQIHSHTEDISAITVMHAGSAVVYSAGSSIHWHELQANPNSVPIPTPLLTTHKGPITCLSLSIDSTLLASASSSAVHIHNLSLSTTTPLRGLAHPISTCTFHPHIRTRLLIASERQLLIYDTTRPSSPSKKIPMTEAVQGEICAVTCSPFSKTLVAVATVAGSIALIDLDKEKGLFKMLNVHVPLTSILFSPDGSTIYLGTETGKLLLLDLRTLDKPPKETVIEDGAKVQCMGVQKKKKAAEASAPAAVSTATARRVVSKSSTKSEVAALTKKPAAKASSPASKKTEKSSHTSSPIPSSASTKSPSQKSDISVDLDVFDTRRKPGVVSVIKTPPSPSESPTPTATGRAHKLQRTSSVVSARSTKLSPGTRTQKGRISSSRSTGSLRPASSTPISSISTLNKPSARRTTPSPDLPGIDEPITPITVVKRRAVSTASAAQVLGEHSPKSKKGKGKVVDFVDDEDGDQELEPKAKSPWDKGKENEFEYVARQQLQHNPAPTDMQISPRRPGLAPSSSVPSPLRPFTGSASGSAQELLRSLVRDVMYEHQQETKAELMGLHLDLIRAGRGWKQELRDIMDEYMGDLRELREENMRLRRENEMLRRGY